MWLPTFHAAITKKLVYVIVLAIKNILFGCRHVKFHLERNKKAANSV